MSYPHPVIRCVEPAACPTLTKVNGIEPAGLVHSPVGVIHKRTIGPIHRAPCGEEARFFAIYYVIP